MVGDTAKPAQDTGRGSHLKHGLVIGKFYPPHRGHKFLIDSALEQVDHLDVILCARPDQSIPGSVRASWLRTIHPTVNVIEVADPGRDHDSQFWADYTRKILGHAPDVVFTSEEYGERYAHLLGSIHVSVDPERHRVPVSGTQIRQNPMAHLDFLEPCVRAYFVKRVAIVGAESTGKTTLAQVLADHYHTVWVPEYGREYTEVNVGPERIFGYQWRSEEFIHIAQRQIELEDHLAEQANRVLICDTDALATAIWHERYMQSLSPEVQALADSRRYNLYLLTAVDIPFVQDGVRDGEHIRAWMTGRFREELERRNLEWVLLRGDHDTRMRTAVRAIDTILKDRSE